MCSTVSIFIYFDDSVFDRNLGHYAAALDDRGGGSDNHVARRAV